LNRILLHFSAGAKIFYDDTGQVLEDLAVTLFSILPEPAEDLFPTDGERRQSLDEQRRSREAALADYGRILAGAGIRADRIETRLVIRRCPSLGDAILEAQDELRCCIVVLGRRGLSHQEEFIIRLHDQQGPPPCQALRGHGRRVGDP